MGHNVGVAYIDLSNIIDSLIHELLIAKLKCYGLDQHTVDFFSYLSDRYPCCKINNTLGDWRKIITTVPQGSILGPFFFLKDANLRNNADDSTLYAYNKNLETVAFNLKQEFSILSNWFYNNYMVLNSEKCHFMLLAVKENEQFDMIYNGITLKYSSHEKILGVTIDNKLCFHKHIINLCKAVNKRFNTVSRINHYMKKIKRKYYSQSPISAAVLLFECFCSKKSIE